jgi:HlyD family secretion protein
MKKLSNLTFLLIGLLILGTGGFYFWISSDTDESNENYLQVQIKRGDVRRTVSSTGVLQAVVTVQVGSQVSGRIQALNADFNSVVKKGQVLAVIDPAHIEAQRDRAQAHLATAEASVENSEANVINRQAELENAEANLEVAQVNFQEAGRQLRRATGLFKDGLIPERDLETAQASDTQSSLRIRQAKAQISQIHASIRSAKAQRQQSKASVKQARAEVKMAQVNLRYTNIVSPIDGVVIERNVDIGQTVAASFQAPVLFLIANDLAKMQVIAQIDEADIGAISEMAGVEFTVDAFPGESFEGKISEIRLSSKLPGASATSTTASGANNVVVYNVMIDVDNPTLKLRPAMTATVNFTVAKADNVLKVANVALRYRPSDVTPEEIQTMLRGQSSDEEKKANQSPKDSEPGYSERDRPPMSPERIRALRERMAQSGQGRPFGSTRSEWSRGRRMGRQDSENSGTKTIIARSSTSQYGINAGLKIRFPSSEKTKTRSGLLWSLDAENQLQPHRVSFGITDGRETAILNGSLKEGDIVISGELNTEVQTTRTSSPFGGVFGSRRPPQRNRSRAAGRNQGSRSR